MYFNPMDEDQVGKDSSSLLEKSSTMEQFNKIDGSVEQDGKLKNKENDISKASKDIVLSEEDLLLMTQNLNYREQFFFEHNYLEEDRTSQKVDSTSTLQESTLVDSETFKDDKVISNEKSIDDTQPKKIPESESITSSDHIGNDEIKVANSTEHESILSVAQEKLEKNEISEILENSEKSKVLSNKTDISNEKPEASLSKTNVSTERTEALSIKSDVSTENLEALSSKTDISTKKLSFKDDKVISNEKSINDTQPKKIPESESITTSDHTGDDEIKAANSTEHESILSVAQEKLEKNEISEILENSEKSEASSNKTDISNKKPEASLSKTNISTEKTDALSSKIDISTEKPKASSSKTDISTEKPGDTENIKAEFKPAISKPSEDKNLPKICTADNSIKIISNQESNYDRILSSDNKTSNKLLSTSENKINNMQNMRWLQSHSPSDYNLPLTKLQAKEERNEQYFEGSKGARNRNRCENNSFSYDCLNDKANTKASELQKPDSSVIKEMEIKKDFEKNCNIQQDNGEKYPMSMKDGNMKIIADENTDSSRKEKPRFNLPENLSSRHENKPELKPHPDFVKFEVLKPSITNPLEEKNKFHEPRQQRCIHGRAGRDSSFTENSARSRQQNNNSDWGKNSNNAKKQGWQDEEPQWKDFEVGNKVQNFSNRRHDRYARNRFSRFEDNQSFAQNNEFKKPEVWDFEEINYDPNKKPGRCETNNIQKFGDAGFNQRQSSGNQWQQLKQPVDTKAKNSDLEHLRYMDQKPKNDTPSLKDSDKSKNSEKDSSSKSKGSEANSGTKPKGSEPSQKNSDKDSGKSKGSEGPSQNRPRRGSNKSKNSNSIEENVADAKSSDQPQKQSDRKHRNSQEKITPQVDKSSEANQTKNKSAGVKESSNCSSDNQKNDFKRDQTLNVTSTSSFESREFNEKVKSSNLSVSKVAEVNIGSGFDTNVAMCFEGNQHVQQVLGLTQHFQNTLKVPELQQTESSVTTEVQNYSSQALTVHTNESKQAKTVQNAQLRYPLLPDGNDSFNWQMQLNEVTNQISNNAQKVHNQYNKVSDISKQLSSAQAELYAMQVETRILFEKKHLLESQNPFAVHNVQMVPYPPFSFPAFASCHDVSACTVQQQQQQQKGVSYPKDPNLYATQVYRLQQQQQIAKLEQQQTTYYEQQLSTNLQQQPASYYHHHYQEQQYPDMSSTEQQNGEQRPFRN